MKGFTVRRSRFAVRRWHPGAYLDCEAEIHRGAPLGSSVSGNPGAQLHLRLDHLGALAPMRHISHPCALAVRRFNGEL